METIAVKHLTNRSAFLLKYRNGTAAQTKKMSSTTALRLLMKIAKHTVIDIKHFAQLRSSYIVNQSYR